MADEAKVDNEDIDISIYLANIHVAWQQGVLNASDSKEIKRILLNNKYHHLISVPLLRFVESFKRLQQSNDDNKQNDEEDNIEIDGENDINIQGEIQLFQNSIRPSIQRAIQLSYSAMNHNDNNNNNNISFIQILNKIMDNRVLSKDILYFIENAILSINNGQKLSTISDINFCNDSSEIDNDKIISIQQCYDFVSCDNKKNLDKDILSMIENALNDELSIYKQCMESLNDEINIIKSIFSTEHDHIAVHLETLPIVIELCLSSTNNIAKLYMTFLCPMDYPLKSPIKSSIYFCGPTSFATHNEIWIELQLKLQEMAVNAIGEQHLFDIVQFAKEWIERYEQKYNEKKQSNDTLPSKHNFIELRTALGLVDNADKKFSAYYSIEHNADNIDDTTSAIIIQHHVDSKNKNGNNGKNGVDMNGKTYVWYWKDINNNWCEFPKNMQKKIHHLPINDGLLSFSTNNYDYIITKTSEAKGIQTNCDTNSQRQIKRKIRKLKNFVDRSWDTHKPQSPEQYLMKRGRTKKERRKQREIRERENKLNKYSRFKSGKKGVEYYSDEEQDEILRRKQLEQQKKQKDKIRKEQLETQCYSSWEIDETIQELIKQSANKWKCSKSVAKSKLAESLWTSDQSIDKQLEQTRNKQHTEDVNNNNNDDDDTMYDIQLNTLNPTTSDLEQDIILEFPSIKNYECPVCLEENSIFAGIRIHCQHIICLSCLSDYIYNQIVNGITIIKCPQYKCISLIDDCIIHILSDNIIYSRYRQFLQNSFLDTSRSWKFCPNPQCNSAIKTKRSIPLLACNCSTPLCTQCMNKFHWPLKCRENIKWAEKTKSKIKLEDPNLPSLPQFEGQKYEMLVSTKKCPKCQTPWEKAGGCNHVFCRKCKYHFCWVCLKEFNQKTHDDFYECKQGVITSTKSNMITMEKPTERYINAYQDALEKRKKLREEHEEKLAADAQRKTRTKKAIQHERASIFLKQKYLKKPRRLKVLLKNIILSTQNNKEKIPKKLDLKFMYDLISRLIETHLLLSRGYKYISYHSMQESHTICNILKSLEHVAFKMDAMFQDPKVYLAWNECRWKWYDLGFYIEFFINECCKIINPKKEKKQYIDPKPKKTNPFMKVSDHQY